MAGVYPDVPSRRMAYDRDGTVVQGVAAELNSDAVPPQADGVPMPTPYVAHSVINKQKVENENQGDFVAVSAGINGSAYIVWQLIFPELREIDGYFWNANGNGALEQKWLYYSGDTTSGRDGTWNALGSQVVDTATVYENYRNSIQTAAINTVRSVTALMRDNGNSWLRRFHVYGEISAGETPDRLLWVDNATGSEFVLPIDYGDIPRGSASDRVVKLRNNSGSLTASSVQVTSEAGYRNANTWLTFGEGGAFQSTLPLASSIGPGSDSPNITVRRNTPDSADTGLYAARIYAAYLI